MTEVQINRPTNLLREAPWRRRQRGIVLSYILVIALVCGISIFSHGFLNPIHLRILLIQAAILGIVAAGQSLAILTGGIDLSVAWMLNLVTVLVTLLAPANHDLWYVLPIILLIAIVVGTINGIAIAAFRLPPIIVTLGMGGVLEGALLVYTNGGETGSAMPPDALTFLAEGNIGPIPMALLCWVIVIVAVSGLLSRTTMGRHIYAIGNGPIVARMAGINSVAALVLVYVVSAVTAAFAGLLLTGYLGQVYLGMGDPYLFTSIAAVLVGGASILGGTGHYMGTVAGAIILTVASGLLAILNASPGVLDILYGVLILVTVGLTTVTMGRVALH